MPAFDVYVRRRNANNTGTEEVLVPYVPGNPIAFDEDGEPVATGGTLKVASVILTDAQIKALPSASVVIVPGVTGKVIVLVAGTWRLDASAGAYTADAASSWQLQMDVFPDAVPISSVAAITTKLQSTDPSFGQFTPQNYTDAAFGTIGIGFDDDLGNFEGLPLSIGDYYTGVGDYTGGNAANTLKVTVWYLEVEV